MSVTVTPVSGRRDLDAFIKLPFHLYRDDPNWVPPLLFRERKRFSPKTNPFLQHADAQLFLAHRNEETVARISAQVDHEHNRFHEERTGFFGFFESEDDLDAARQYLAMAYPLCDEVYRRARDGGYRWSEFSWTLEDNNAVNTIIRNVGCRKYKTYRIYERPLSP